MHHTNQSYPNPRVNNTCPPARNWKNKKAAERFQLDSAFVDAVRSLHPQAAGSFVGYLFKLAGYNAGVLAEAILAACQYAARKLIYDPAALLIAAVRGRWQRRPEYGLA